MRCPLCRDEISDARALPFCSERCRSQDLGKWLDGDYRIIGERVDPMTLPDTASDAISTATLLTREDPP